MEGGHGRTGNEWDWGASCEFSKKINKHDVNTKLWFEALYPLIMCTL